MAEISLHAAMDGAELEAVRSLCWDYRAFLTAMDGVSAEVTDAFNPPSKYAALMEDLPRLHARPKGLILLARAADGAALGCGMSHPLDDQTSEIKRVFVNDAARGQGVAAMICERLVQQAKADGFGTVVLDTHRLLHSAQRLYLRLGFTARGPYQRVPDTVLDELRFFEKSLMTQEDTA